MVYEFSGISLNTTPPCRPRRLFLARGIPPKRPVYINLQSSTACDRHLTQLLARFSRLMILGSKFQALVTRSTAFCKGTEASTNISRTTGGHSGDRDSE